MDHHQKSKSLDLFAVVANGDDITLQRLLLEGKQERNIATLAHGNTLLHEVAWKGYSRCVKILCNVYPKDLDEIDSKEKLNKKKNLFINRTNFSGFTALHLAAQNGHNQSTRELLYAGCSTSIQNDYGDTALHTCIRYGHAGILRILISAKIDIDAFNLNNDTPLHISAAMGRRKLTKLLVEAGAMQFRNNQNQTPRDIGEQKNLREIVEIIDNYSAKIDQKMIRESVRKSGRTHQCFAQTKEFILSPYGCHFYPNLSNFPSPKLQTLPKEPLQKGEIYYLDLGGNIKKGPVGITRCSCSPFSKEAMVEQCKNIQKYVDRANEKLNRKIIKLTTKIEKTERKQQRERSKEREIDPLYPLLKIVGDKNKQIHLEKWLKKVYPENGGSTSEKHSSDFTKEIQVDVHREMKENKSAPIKVLKRTNSRKMPQYDIENDAQNCQMEENDDSYTDISDDYEEENGESLSNSDNPLYDEAFIRNYQQQQLQNSHQNDSITSPSINSNQNIEIEMEKIAKSLMLNEEGMMVNSRNPDVIKDIHHSAKRSTKKIKSAITKPTTILSSGDLYVNSFFNDNGESNNQNFYQKSHSDADEIDCCEIDQLVTSIISMQCNNQPDENGNNQSNQTSLWDSAGRSRNRNPLPVDMYTESLFKKSDDLNNPVQNINDNNFMMLDKLLRARKHLSRNNQQSFPATNNEHTDIPRSSLV